MNTGRRIVGKSRRGEVLKARRARKARQQPQPSTCDPRNIREERRQAVESQPWIAEAIEASQKCGLELKATPIRGVASGLHLHWKRNGIHVADYWPTDGRLSIGGRSHWPDDVDAAIRIVVEQLNITRP